MTTNTFVTIILTCYKQEKFIEETILSVVNQKYKNWELLIWDDSPDGKCWDIISKYTKKYPDKIHAWHHYPNKWIVNNMQFLLDQRNKESEYVAFLEWDDCLFPEYLEKKLEIFGMYPNVQLVYNELTTINETWNMIEKFFLKSRVKKYYKSWKVSYNKLVTEMLYSSRSTIMVRSGIINKYNLYPKFLWKKTTLSDVYFFDQIANNEDIHCINIPLVFYRIHKSSTSWSIKWLINMNFERIEYLKYLYNNSSISKTIYNEWINRIYFSMAVLLIKECLSIWILITFKSFINALYFAIKIRVGKFINNRFK